jgi:3-hydroxyethyl bacteriochlorophyllide a dehydrogenase
MNMTHAVVLEAPEQLVLSQLALDPAGDADLVVDIDFSGISTGTEKLLWTGRMPTFPGMGYPLVPGYESVGRVVAAGPQGAASGWRPVFVPGARCFGPVRGLFGGAASRLVVGDERVYNIDPAWAKRRCCWLWRPRRTTRCRGVANATPSWQPDLIIGHGVLGRLLARLTVAAGLPPPTVWETNATRAEGDFGYAVIHPETDTRRDYRAIYDVSGDVRILDTVMPAWPRGAKSCWPAFTPSRCHSTSRRPSCAKPPSVPLPNGSAPTCWPSRNWPSPARCAWTASSPTRSVPERPDAYRTAFGDAACLKMVLDWRTCQ